MSRRRAARRDPRRVNPELTHSPSNGYLVRVHLARGFPTVPTPAGDQPWYFGVMCEHCGSFIPVGRDETDGRPGARLPSGTVIVQCRSCGHRGRYAAGRVEQRRTEHRA